MDDASHASDFNRTDKVNESGFAKICIRNGDYYREGIVDRHGNSVIEPRSNMLVNDISGSVALLQIERKFLFVDLTQHPITKEWLDQSTGYQYAEPYQCGLAKVVQDDAWFYLDSKGNPAFDEFFDFAESFHEDRALVKKGDDYFIIDTHGNCVKDLEFEQVSPQGPWCWQVTEIIDGKYMSGFVGLNGEELTPRIYENVGYYDPEVKRIPVSKDGLHGFLNEVASVAIPLIYEYAEIFDRGKARVSLEGREFYIDPNGQEVPE